MAFIKKIWKDRPDKTTPINADGLNDLESRIGVKKIVSTGGALLLKTFTTSGTTPALLIGGGTVTIDLQHDIDVLISISVVLKTNTQVSNIHAIVNGTPSGIIGSLSSEQGYLMVTGSITRSLNKGLNNIQIGISSQSSLATATVPAYCRTNIVVQEI